MYHFDQVTFTSNAQCCKNWKIDENASLGIFNFLETFQYLITICSRFFIESMFGNDMYYFDQVTFTKFVMRKKVCVDISHFSLFALVKNRQKYLIYLRL